MSSITEKLNNLVMKIADPLVKFSELKSISAIQEALVSTMPIIIIGSLFLVCGVLGSPSVGDSGEPVLSFLAPWSANFYHMNSITMNFLAFYVCVSLGIAYSKKLDIDITSGVLLAVASFFILNVGSIDDNLMSVANFSASGLFTTMFSTIIVLRIFKFFLDKNITIKLPKEVPPNIGRSFTSLIPYAVIFVIAWVIRSILQIDFVAISNNLLAPFISAGDNIFSYTFRQFMTNLLWSAGLHGDNMFVAPIFSPFETLWLAENAEAVANGLSGTELPHIMTANGMDRMTNWTACVWPLIFLMITSKVKHLRTLGIACLPSAIFTIVEPVIFALPLALNPFLLIPYLLTAVITAIVSYLSFALNLLDRFFVSLPWATPPFILGPVGTGGDLKTIILIVVVFLIGLVIYRPFFKKYEEHLMGQNEKATNETE